MTITMDIYIIFLSLLIVMGSNYDKNGCVNTDKINFQAYKGVFALVILFHHISQRINCSFFSIFNSSGTLMVAGFLLLSGFGITKSCEINSYKNINVKWFYNKVVRLIIPWAFCFLGGLIDKIFFDVDSELFPISWFILIMIYIYIAYAISFKNRFNFWIQMCMLTVFGLLWVLFVNQLIKNQFEFAIFSDVGGWWAWPVFSFPVGILWEKYEEKISHLILNKYSVIFLVICIIIINQGLQVGTTYVMLVVDVVVSFVLIWIVSRIRLTNPILIWIGKYSMEFFVIHTFLLGFLRQETIYIHDDVVYTFFVLLITFLFVIPVERISGKFVLKNN